MPVPGMTSGPLNNPPAARLARGPAGISAPEPGTSEPLHSANGKPSGRVLGRQAAFQARICRPCGMQRARQPAQPQRGSAVSTRAAGRPPGALPGRARTSVPMRLSSRSEGVEASFLTVRVGLPIRRSAAGLLASSQAAQSGAARSRSSGLCPRAGVRARARLRNLGMLAALHAGASSARASIST